MPRGDGGRRRHLELAEMAALAPLAQHVPGSLGLQYGFHAAHLGAPPKGPPLPRRSSVVTSRVIDSHGRPGDDGGRTTMNAWKGSWSLERNEQPAVEAHGLVKSFGETRAVDGLELAVPTGTVYGVLGPNGAGKTTTIRMLATLLRPDAGTARVLGHDVIRDAAAVRARVGLTGQFAAVDEELTGRENLILLGRLLGISRARVRARADELLNALGLEDAADRHVKTYSGGMRRRVDLAASIIVTPDLLFLDEPTTGLDPHSRNQIWEIVRAMVAAGTTVLLTTQYLEEADRLADRIAGIGGGKGI